MIKETMKAEAAALIAEMRKHSVTGTSIMLSAGSNGLLVAAFDAMLAEIDSKLWAVNIPEEPDSEELLFAATSKEHAQSIVSRLHNEIFETYPTFGEAIADSIYVTEWQDSAEEHAESLATKWWEVTSFLENE